MRMRAGLLGDYPIPDETARVAALNLVRVGAWLAETPRATTRRPPFVQLMGV
jgi:hypothetical protein